MGIIEAKDKFLRLNPSCNKELPLEVAEFRRMDLAEDTDGLDKIREVADVLEVKQWERFFFTLNNIRVLGDEDFPDNVIKFEL